MYMIHLFLQDLYFRFLQTKALPFIAVLFSLYSILIINFN